MTFTFNLRCLQYLNIDKVLLLILCKGKLEVIKKLSKSNINYHISENMKSEAALVTKKRIKAKRRTELFVFDYFYGWCNKGNE